MPIWCRRCIFRFFNERIRIFQAFEKHCSRTNQLYHNCQQLTLSSSGAKMVPSKVPFALGRAKSKSGRATMLNAVPVRRWMIANSSTKKPDVWEPVRWSPISKNSSYNKKDYKRRKLSINLYGLQTCYRTGFSMTRTVVGHWSRLEVIRTEMGFALGRTIRISLMGTDPTKPFCWAKKSLPCCWTPCCWTPCCWTPCATRDPNTSDRVKKLAIIVTTVFFNSTKLEKTKYLNSKLRIFADRISVPYICNKAPYVVHAWRKYPYRCGQLRVGFPH